MLNIETYEGSFTRGYTAAMLFFMSCSVVPRVFLAGSPVPAPLTHYPVSFIVVPGYGL